VKFNNPILPCPILVQLEKSTNAKIKQPEEISAQENEETANITNPPKTYKQTAPPGKLSNATSTQEVTGLKPAALF